MKGGLARTDERLRYAQVWALLGGVWFKIQREEEQIFWLDPIIPIQEFHRQKSFLTEFGTDEHAYFMVGVHIVCKHTSSNGSNRKPSSAYFSYSNQIELPSQIAHRRASDHRHHLVNQLISFYCGLWRKLSPHLCPHTKQLKSPQPDYPSSHLRSVRYISSVTAGRTIFGGG
jgi:hypothetical protein